MAEPAGRIRPGFQGVVVTLVVTISLASVLALPGAARAEDSAADLAAAAMRECEAGQVAPTRTTRVEHFETGLALAEKAVAADDTSAPAHFALFCNLGESLRVDGEKITSIFGFRRMMAELDRTLELDPNHIDARSSKGVMLIRLPRLLGGDPPRGEQMLERVVREDPTSITARLTLADVYSERGKRDEAVAFAARALQAAKTQNRPDKVAKCEATLARLKASPAEIDEIQSRACPDAPDGRCPGGDVAATTPRG